MPDGSGAIAISAVTNFWPREIGDPLPPRWRCLAKGASRCQAAPAAVRLRAVSSSARASRRVSGVHRLGGVPFTQVSLKLCWEFLRKRLRRTAWFHRSCEPSGNIFRSGRPAPSCCSSLGLDARVPTHGCTSLFDTTCPTTGVRATVALGVRNLHRALQGSLVQRRSESWGEDGSRVGPTRRGYSVFGSCVNGHRLFLHARDLPT